ncbi:MAG: TfoX/Sxy family protein [Ruminococcus sp.]
MATTKDYLQYILEQLSGMEEISHRAMMGEYILYYRGKVFGGIYDNRFLVKPTKSARALLPDAPMELPYEGAKEMLLIQEPEDRELTTRLLEAMEKELPAPKPKKRKPR